MEINKQELYEYYVTQNHTSQETINHFNISSTGVFYKICNKFNIKKNIGLDNIKKIITKEAIINYIKINPNIKETINYFNISPTYFYNLCKQYNIELVKTPYFQAQQEITKDKLYSYYIEQNHTIIETKNYFKISRNTINNLLNFYNINKKLNKTQFKSHYDEKKFYDYYIEQNHTIKQTQKYFNMTQSDFNKALEFYHINKIKINQNNIINNNGIRVKKEDIFNYYINEKHPRKDTLEYFNISAYKFRNILDIYNISKTKHNKKPEIFKNIINRISKEDLYNYYITNNNSTLDTLNKFNISQPILSRLMKHYNIQFKNGFSHYESDIEKYFPTIKFIKNARVLNKKEIDLYSPELNIGIEFNGNYWHSSLEKPKNYHFNKSKEAENNNIRLIHIWEYEWNNPIIRDKIISLLRIALNQTPSKIYARNCIIKRISNIEAKQFNDLNHLQNHRNAQITYGLFYNDKLVQLMSFSKTKYNKNLKGNNDWEIIRGCPGSNNIVIGGVSKLFKHFIKDYNPDTIFSYCDFNKFNGKGYENLGMEFIGYTGPDMKWLMPNHEVINRQPYKHNELKLNSKAQLWGAGSKKYIWRKINA